MSKKVRIGLVGCGGYMGVHARRLKSHPDVEIVGLCDLTTEIADAFYEKNLAGYTVADRKPPCFIDAPAMYAATRPDAVMIATPHTLHFGMGMAALDAGLHVYMEKPMVTSAADAYTLAARAKEKGRILVVGYNTSCTPEFAFLREQIRSKALGRLELIVGCISQDWKRFTTGLWRQDPKQSGGGQAYDSGAHLLNSLIWSVESPVAEVHAFTDNVGTPVDVNSSINVRFANGVLASIVISGNCPSDSTHMNFIFDNGRIEIDGWGGNWINVWKGRERVKYPPITAKPMY